MADNWRSLETDIRASFASSEMFAEFAAEMRDEVIARDHPSGVTTYVDGREGTPLTAVKAPDGVIRFEFSYGREIVAEIFNMLVMASPYAPKRPGADWPKPYKDCHAIFVNGAEVDDITDIPADAVVTFVNLAPYSRKIERGLSMQAPSGVYQMVAQLARTKFGKVADISFGYDIFPHAGPKSRAGRRSNVASKSRRDDRFPTITVKTLS